MSSSVGGRVSPTIAKLSDESVPPPGPTVPELEEDELDDELELDELDDDAPPEELELEGLDELDELDGLDEPEQPQGPLASCTHWLSHMVVQQ